MCKDFVNFLSQQILSFFSKIFEKISRKKNIFIDLPFDLKLNFLRKLLNQTFFNVIKLMLDLNRFINVINYVGFELILKKIFLAHLIEYFKFKFSLLIH